MTLAVEVALNLNTTNNQPKQYYPKCLYKVLALRIVLHSLNDVQSVKVYLDSTLFFFVFFFCMLRDHSTFTCSK